MRDFLFLKTNSIGSSTVIICFGKCLFIISISAARVVDFHDQTAPVTNTSPFFTFVKSRSLLGNPSSSIFGSSFLIGLKTTPNHFFSEKVFTLNLA